MYRRSIDYSGDAVAERVTKTLTLEKRICWLESAIESGCAIGGSIERLSNI